MTEPFCLNSGAIIKMVKIYEIHAFAAVFSRAAGDDTSSNFDGARQFHYRFSAAFRHNFDCGVPPLSSSWCRTPSLTSPTAAPTMPAVFVSASTSKHPFTSLAKRTLLQHHSNLNQFAQLLHNPNANNVARPTGHFHPAFLFVHPDTDLSIMAQAVSLRLCHYVYHLPSLPPSSDIKYPNDCV